ncbi:MAG: zinc/manganese transport system permease protein [Solirubrobacteraceae bacterium]|jgi:zinc/manganese transport system permease protein|nr:zinc/manganese transport system permease protein [Solirubrobacteraceae bacterium]
MPAEGANPTLTWNLAHDISQVLEYHFMINALLAGSAVAVLAGLVGWMMLVRREAFAGHTLALMAFPGASAAALAGVAAAWGYLTFCAAGALAIARLPGGARGSWREEAAGVGVVQALALALGFLFVSLYGGVLGDLEGLLFGNLLGVSDGQVLELVVVGLAVTAVLAAIARPLLLSSVDPEGAAARGLPVGALSSGFLLLLGLAVAATSQVTGPLLVFSLLVMPAASAQAITSRPAPALAASVAIGLVVVWLGLAVSYFSVYPPGFWITVVAFAVYLLSRLVAGASAGRRRRGVATGTSGLRAPAASRAA